jgi:hypothetical protein
MHRLRWTIGRISSELVSADLVHIVSLGTHGSTLFETLVIGPANDTLDEGKAAMTAEVKRVPLHPN